MTPRVLSRRPTRTRTIYTLDTGCPAGPLPMSTYPQQKRTHVLVLDDVDSPSTKLVLLYLYERGPTTPSQLADELDLALTSTLGVLDILTSRGHVERREGRIHCAL